MVTPRRDWPPRFLDVLRQVGSVSAAAQAAGIARQEVYRRRHRDRSFAEARDEATAEAAEELEGELWRRAMEGVEQPVYYAGEVVGTTRLYSDKLAMFLLRGLMPERYGDHVRLERAVETKTRELAKRYGLSEAEVQRRARQLADAR